MVLRALNVPNDLQPMQPDPLPMRTWREARAVDLVWAREYLVPWVLRRLRHQSSGDNVTAKRPDPMPVTALTPAQRTRLLELVALHIDNMDEGHARVKMAEIRQHLDATWFAWIGGTGPESVFYYRIHSPVVLIEFDHQLPVGVRQLVANPRVPFRDHIHVVVRTPNGNDYGKDLLRQHYAAQRGNAAHGHVTPTVPSSNAW